MTTRFRSFSLVSAALLALALPARAAEATKRPVDLAQRISLDLVEAAPADVFASFGKVLDLEVQLDAAVTAPVTIRLRNVSIATSLQAVCESIECRWRFESGRLAIHPRPAAGPSPSAPPTKSPLPATSDQPISLSLRGARLADVLRSFGKILEVEIEVAPDVAEAPISLDLQNVPARAAFDAVLDLAGAEAVELSAEPRRLAVRKRS